MSGRKHPCRTYMRTGAFPERDLHTCNEILFHETPVRYPGGGT